MVSFCHISILGLGRLNFRFSGVMSILDAATADLANLINRLDLEATPDGSPLRRTPRSAQSIPRDVEEDTLDFLGKTNSLQDSPLRMLQSQRTSSTSLSSLRPYSFAGGAEFRSAVQAAAISNAAKSQIELINQNILPWQMLNAPLEEVMDQLNPPMEDRKSTRLNSSHSGESRMPSSA